jgi:hypothetical protein
MKAVFALVLQKLFWGKHLVRKGLQNISSLHRIGWRSTGKSYPFFKQASSRFLWLQLSPFDSSALSNVPKIVSTEPLTDVIILKVFC